jgi:DNA-binding winged helix-turn-helix (wHTH) protein/tetratricopeptide (TPR) repeat protein
MLLRFADFELDRQRMELRGPDGQPIKIRLKAFGMLLLFLDNAGRVISKQELMQVLWPNVHVGDDSVFQCIRELRTSLGDDKRQIIKSVIGVGYLFDVPVSSEPAAGEAPEAAIPQEGMAEPGRAWRLFGLRGPARFAAVAAFGALFGLAIAAAFLGRDAFTRKPPTIAVMPISGADADVAPTGMAVTVLLTDGLAKIDNVRVVTPGAATSSQGASTPADPADFVLSGELRKTNQSWELQARMTTRATREVIWTARISAAIDGPDVQLQRVRLAAGLGYQLARRINELGRDNASGTTAARAAAKVVIDQATASINRTNKERFATAQTILKSALARDPDNVDLTVALVALQLRGVQMQWYGRAESVEVETNAKAMLERALRAEPNSVAVHEAYCRFLTATNRFSGSLVACAQTLRFDPWDGMALYDLGLTQLQLGRFDDALATFKQADRFDTPQVSRWTWLLGAGMTLMLMDRSEEALPWLQRSLAITPGSGRTYMLVSAAFERLGRTAEAKAAMAKGLSLRPGSNLSNVTLPTKNASPIFIRATKWIVQAYLAAGLPER